MQQDVLSVQLSQTRTDPSVLQAISLSIVGDRSKQKSETVSIRSLSDLVDVPPWQPLDYYFYKYWGSSPASLKEDISGDCCWP